jgi:hypothetical protein
MKRLIATTTLLLVIPIFAPAQSADHHYPWQAYSIFGVGSDPPIIYPISPYFGGYWTLHSDSKQVAFGGEGILKVGLGLGFEMGWTKLLRSSIWLRTPSLYVSYHFPSVVHRKVEPFVQAGATVMNYGIGEDRGYACANLGGGVNLWVTRHLALRSDVKGFRGDAAFPEYPNFLEFRFGVTFR